MSAARKVSKRTAIHEAGHAIVAHVFNLQPSVFAIDSDICDTCREHGNDGPVTIHKHAPTVGTALTVALAGVAAEHAHFGNPGGGGSSDYEHVVDILGDTDPKYTGLNTGLTIEAFTGASRIIGKHRAALEGLAKAFQKRDLTEGGVAALLAGVPQRGRRAKVAS